MYCEAEINFLKKKRKEMETGIVKSFLVLQKNDNLTSFKGDCRYYILTAIILILF